MSLQCWENTNFRDGFANEVQGEVPDRSLGHVDDISIDLFLLLLLHGMKFPEEYQDSLGLYLAFGALAGLFGSTCTYPLEVVRRQSRPWFLVYISFYCLNYDAFTWFYKVDYLQQGEARYSSTRRGLTSILRNGLSINYMKNAAGCSFSIYWIYRIRRNEVLATYPNPIEASIMSIYCMK
ncbi:hypothetical protein POTOM_013261 [Populus tomentosa]|uniref:Uncharacterized protein n=1 Tax=Populus tomentosa TaxID=118781 RepID=A0A8X8A2B4_POPTO|nr:hypothetical protein POTOM_013261 [Populus tomentosa]